MLAPTNLRGKPYFSFSPAAKELDDFTSDMPICSYLVHPVKGKFKALKRKLLLLPGCEVRPAKNLDILILITETNGEAEETKLQESIKKIKEIQCLALTFGSVDKVVDTLDLNRKGS